MSLDPVTAILDIGALAIKTIWPDPVKQAEEQRKLAELAQNGSLAELNATVKLMLAQVEVNKVEAQHKSLFVAGWRPYIGWTGGFALTYAGVVYPVLTWVWAALEASGKIPSGVSPPPLVEAGVLGTIVTGMLGVGTMRSYDKNKRTQTDSLR